jgi:Chaperone of endosialidase
MNPLIQLKKITSSSVIALLLAFRLVPLAHAVVPPPDGGYPGGNTAEGQNALLSLSTGTFNTAVGFLSLRDNTQGSFNTAIGAGTLLVNTISQQNTAIGAGALLSGGAGFNTANGAFALVANTTGFGNTAFGAGALANNTTGTGNIALGSSAGSVLTTGDFNIYIGNGGFPSESSTIRIGAGHTRAFIAGIRGVTTVNNDAIPVLIDSSGYLGTASSSRRFKKEIVPMDEASEAILALKPVRFHYKSDSTKRLEFGLIAEEVAEVNPDLVVRDENGEIYTVRYEAVNAMLLNEFLKEHRKVEQQHAIMGQLQSNAARQELTIGELKKEMGVLTMQLQEQAAQIQKVSARIGANYSAPQAVVNSR